MHHNILDAAPIDAMARRMAAKIPLEGPAARIARLIFEYLSADLRNFRNATAVELLTAEPWARREIAAGRPVLVFASNRASAARVRRFAEAVRDTCAEVDHLTALEPITPREEELKRAAADFIAKLDRASFETIELKARMFARGYTRRQEDKRAARRLCADEEVFSSPGRVWRRITSVADLWGVGKEFGNCLTRASRHGGGFSRRMTEGDAQFWVLRDQNGKGLMVVMIYMLERRIAEARGPRNAPVFADDPDLAALARAKGFKAPENAPWLIPLSLLSPDLRRTLRRLDDIT